MASQTERQYRLFTTVPYSWTSGSQWSFTVSGVTVAPAVGDTYTNNTATFTLLTVTLDGDGAGVIVATGTGAPAASGDLTVDSGDGDETLTFSEVHKVNALYLTLPAGTAKIQCWLNSGFAAAVETLSLNSDSYAAAINISGGVYTWGEWLNNPTTSVPEILFDPDGSTQPIVKFFFDGTSNGVFSAAVYVMPEYGTTISTAYAYEA